MRSMLPIRIERIARILFSALFLVSGIYHFVNPDLYRLMMPEYLPWHLALIYLSGAAEVLLGAMLLAARWSQLAGWGLIALLVAIFPANVHMAVHTDRYPWLSPLLLWMRLPLQLLLIAWAYYYARRGSHER